MTLKEALKADFNNLFSPGFRADWEAARFIIGIDIDIMSLENVERYIKESSNAERD